MNDLLWSLRFIHFVLLYVYLYVFTLVHDSVHREQRALIFKNNEDGVVYELFRDTDDFDQRLFQFLQDRIIANLLSGVLLMNHNSQSHLLCNFWRETL